MTAQQVGAGPVVELAVGDANDVADLRLGSLFSPFADDVVAATWSSMTWSPGRFWRSICLLDWARNRVYSHWVVATRGSYISVAVTSTPQEPSGKSARARADYLSKSSGRTLR